MKSIFLDYNATTPIAPSVQEAMLPFMAEYFATPDAYYAKSRAVEEALEDARGQVANLLGVTPPEIVFCSSGTESCNLAIQGIANQYRQQGQACHLIGSAVEHPAVMRTLQYCQQMGSELTILPVDRNGLVAPDTLEDALRDDTRLVSIALANEQTGVIQPIEQLAAVCRKRNVKFHTDACQATGKLHVKPKQLQVDLLSLSAHKFYGPKGAAALFCRKGTHLLPLIHGLGNESTLRAGCENVMAYIGMGKAANLVDRSIDAASEKLKGLTDKLRRQLTAAILAPVTVHGIKTARLPNTLSISLPGVNGLEVLKRVPEISAATWSGTTASHGNSSAVLTAMQVSPEEAQGTIRLSVGWYTSEEEIDTACDLLLHAWESLRSN